MSEHFDRYVEGWTKGDVELLLSACAEDFVYDDPIDGRCTKAEIGAYVKSLPGAIEWTEEVAQEIGGVETVWGWWKMQDQQGAALHKVGRDGVHLTKATYYASPQITLAASKAETSA